MQPQRWREIEDLFDRVADLPEASRAAILETTDPELRREVESLLASSSGAGTFIVNAIGEQENSMATVVPRTFGPWRVTGILGQGGMGAVYKAVRDDGVFTKEAAVKVLHYGLGTPAARDRFRQERQILASLEHPNIARLLDGGETPTGLPFLVLEYVDGEPLTVFCQRKQLSTAQRLRLFLEVCSAVDSAHQQLIVHRDLKPGNILVTAAGVPKLLDFGIAKLLDSETAHTQTGFQALTPQYASPEQVRGNPIGTSSDVYSLGVILYELLTHRRPYEVTTNSPGEIDRVVCEQAPTPSGLSGDLDNILLMALRKEPQRRYSGPRALAQDIERHLADLPVLARPDQFSYRATKFLRRNRWPLAAVALVAITLTGGLFATLYQARRAEARFNQVRKLSQTLLFDFYPKLEDLPAAAKAREELLRISLDYFTSLSQEASGDPSLREELAKGFSRLGDLHSAGDYRNLGQWHEAVNHWTRSLQLLEGLNSLGARSLSALLHNRLGFAATVFGQEDEAARHYQLAIAASRTLLKETSNSERVRGILTSALNRLGDLDLNAGRVREAQALFADALALINAVPNGNPQARLSSLARLAEAAWISGNPQEALGFQQQMQKAAEAAASGGDNSIVLDATLMAQALPTKILCAWPNAQPNCASTTPAMRGVLARSLALHEEDPSDAGLKSILIQLTATAQSVLSPTELLPYARASLAAAQSFRTSSSVEDRDLASVALATVAAVDPASRALFPQAAELSRQNRRQAPNRIDFVLQFASILNRWAGTVPATQAKALREEAARALAPFASIHPDHTLLQAALRSLRELPQ